MTRFHAGMTCSGCSNAIKRVLGRVDGVTSVETDVDAKTVVVHGSAPAAALLAALQKWGDASKKEVRLVTE